MDLFICIPPSKLETQSRLLRLLTGIVFLEMQNAMGKIGPHSLLMVIDEMPALGYMKQIEQILTYGRGYGVSLMAISQTIELIKGVYPKSWETFFSNQLSLFFGCNDPMTCEFVSKMIGKTTVETSSTNRGLGKQTRAMELFGSSSIQSGDSVSATGRQLLMPEEIKGLGDRVLLAFMRGEPPILCQRIDYRDREEWLEAWDANPLHQERQENV
jgi:type IV secretion system protein VirD4